MAKAIDMTQGKPTKLLAEKTNIQQTAYVRTPAKLDVAIASHVQVILYSGLYRRK